MHAFSRQVAECIDACLGCHKTCLGMALTHCLESGGDHIAPPHFRLMMDCATICGVTADLMLHKSQFHREMCQMCAAVCATCAADCARIGNMEACVKACRDCAEHCLKMAA
jgi:hypothetical protein